MQLPVVDVRLAWPLCLSRWRADSTAAGENAATDGAREPVRRSERGGAAAFPSGKDAPGADGREDGLPNTARHSWNVSGFGLHDFTVFIPPLALAVWYTLFASLPGGLSVSPLPRGPAFKSTRLLSPPGSSPPRATSTASFSSKGGLWSLCSAVALPVRYSSWPSLPPGRGSTTVAAVVLALSDEAELVEGNNWARIFGVSRSLLAMATVVGMPLSADRSSELASVVAR